jgi:ParB family chromosome partitioning protein
MTTQQTIPLNQLIHSDSNVRHTAKAEGIAALAASIEAHGLRQNLNVMPTDDPKRFAVVAGGRRLRALKRLAKAGKMAKNAPIPCMVLDEGDDPSEISLAENTLRTAMHPDDQFEAFRAMIEERGASIEDVAARFGVTPAVVKQRLKLANVSPALRALYRKGEMSLEHVMALAISDDHAAQEEAWANLPDWNREPDMLKSALTHDTIAVTDKLARFVGIEAYEAAGGAMLRDLFDAEDEGYLADAALVQRLASAKLAEAMTALQAEGWKWVKPELTRDYSTAYDRIRPQRAGEEDEAQEDEDGAEPSEGGEPAFTPEDKACAGVRLSIAHDGTLHIERGLIHPDDRKAERKAGKAGREAGDTTALPASTLPATMVEELTAHRTAALRIELARNPAVALAATVHALALQVVYTGPDASCLALRASSERLETHTQATADSPAHQAIAQEGERWGDRLPGEPEDLFAWCLTQSQQTLLDLLAYLAALSVDAVAAKHRPVRGIAHADRLAEALSLDMRQWWTPTPEGFYQRLPKSALALAVREAKVPPLGVALESVKKTEAARLAAKALSGSGWLPAPLRISEAALAA